MINNVISKTRINQLIQHLSKIQFIIDTEFDFLVFRLTEINLWRTYYCDDLERIADLLRQQVL